MGADYSLFSGEWFCGVGRLLQIRALNEQFRLSKILNSCDSTLSPYFRIKQCDEPPEAALVHAE